MRLNTPRAVLFDLDGTLADTAPDLAAAINHVRATLGLPPTDYAVLRSVASAGARGLIGASFGISTEHEEFSVLRDAFLDRYEQAIAVQSSLFAGIAELLEVLQQRDISWGIVTNKAARLTDRLVPRIGLQCAACVISGDTTPHSKPHPAPLLEAARRLAVSPANCWYVGDDLRDMQAGKAAGMATIAAAWGYCGESEPVSWNADVLAALPADIVRLINAD